MFIFLYLILLVFSAFEPPKARSSAIPATDSVQLLYKQCGADRHISYSVFKKSLEGYRKFKARKPVLAIADMSLPSYKERLFVFDLRLRRLITSTRVTHGKNSGIVMARFFSNQPNSYKTSPGFYLVGKQIVSPKHGQALMLEGLEKGVNDNARQREIIIHGAEYAGEEFVRKYGRCGRSHGCPAIPPDMIRKLAPVLEDGSLLYIHRSGRISD